MKIEKSRHLSILHKILIHDGIITSDDLASATRASVRTIKNDICELNCMLLEDNIGSIVSEPFKGYQFVAVNDEQYDKFKSSVLNQHSFFRKQGLEKMTRRLYITQRLLLNLYTLVDELADEMYLTKSAIKDDLKYVYDFFKSYDLKIETVVGKGLQVVGEEFQIREIMVESFGSQYYSIENNPLHDNFAALFYPNYQYYEDMRHTFLSLLRETQLVLKDIHTKKIATYLCLTVQQILKGHTLHYSQGTKDEIKPTYEYQVALQIVQLDLMKRGFEWSEDEIVGIAILLVCNRDVDLTRKSDLATLPSGIVGAAGNLLDRVIVAMKNELGSDIFNLDLFDLFRSDFISLLIPIQLTSLYDSNARHRLATYNDFMEHKCSPIPTDLARSFLIHVENFIHDELDASLSISFIFLFEYLLKRINFKYKKRRLLVCSTDGLVVSRNLSEFISERFSSFIEYSYVYNIYEMRKLNFNDFDSIITESVETTSNYPLDFTTCDTLSVHDGTIDLFNKVFIQGYDRSIIGYMSQITEIFKQFECDSYITVLKLISYKYARSHMHEALEKSLYRKASKFSYYLPESQIAMVPVDYQFCKKEFIDVYQMKNKINWNSRMEIRYIITYCINPNHSVSEIKMINKILSYCWYEQIEMESLMTNVECTYNEIFDTVILNHFLRK